MTKLFPKTEWLILVMGNLNTHDKASLYQTFPAEEAFELSKSLEIHYTQKHGRWLNITDIVLNVLIRQCLALRLGSLAMLNYELETWKQKETRNAGTYNDILGQKMHESNCIISKFTS